MENGQGSSYYKLQLKRMCLAQSRQASLDHVVPRTLQLRPGNVTDLDEQSSIFPKERFAIVVCYTVQVLYGRLAMQQTH